MLAIFRYYSLCVALPLLALCNRRIGMTPTREGVEGPGRSEPQIPMRGVRERTEEVLSRIKPVEGRA